MRRAIILASILGVTTLGLGLPGLARADSLSVGVQTSNLKLGINIGSTPPPLVVVPGPGMAGPPGPPPPPVYTAPGLPYNYFVYQKQHYLYHEGRWLRAKRHNGPWTVIAIGQVPGPILAVPVEHYKNRPAHWEHHGPPPWANAKGHNKEKGHGGGKSHEKERSHGRDHG
jgi:hypothetical protein